MFLDGVKMQLSQADLEFIYAEGTRFRWEYRQRQGVHRSKVATHPQEDRVTRVNYLKTWGSVEIVVIARILIQRCELR